MNKKDKIAVCSRSFSKNIHLREILNSKYAHVKYNDEGISFYEENLIKFLKDQTKVIIGLEEINENLIANLPSLEVISKYGVGVDNLDLQAMKKNNIKLGWTGGVNKRSVSELVLCLIISLLRMIPQAIINVKSGKWEQFKGNLLTQKTIGILGFGNIGKDLVEILSPFDCNFLVYDVVDISSDNKAVKQAGLDQVLKNSDIVTLHLPFNKSTENLIGLEKFKIMKPNAIFINLSRGGIVDEQALKIALLEKIINGAAMDVFEQEPPQDEDLINIDNFIATPHIGGIAIEAVQAMGVAAIEGLEKNQIPK